ncbi:hypothetical protein Vadar_016452 [Vaccinium darrowii]|uniref:Uncharacterized protein n=1 Tax=Vaccinium darrowii TaxID=229202 RepID=A0ACB7X1F7_9ERIC|nr:hypothetical protein Vadar_016452 [Vaccinium darrowii]
MSGAVEMNSNNKRPREQHSSAPCPTMRLKVKGQDGVDVFFTIKRDTMLRKLLVTYCKKLNHEYKTMEFLYNGERILEGQSPDDLGMEDGDEIDATLHQIRGGVFGDILLRKL